MIAANSAFTKFMLEHDVPLLRRIVREPKRWERIRLLAKENNFNDLPEEQDVHALQVCSSIALGAGGRGREG